MNLHEPYIVARAVVRVLADSEQTAEIHKVEEITGRPKYRALLAKMAADPAARELLRDRPELCSAQVDFDALRTLPADTLGGAYIRHLDAHGLSPDSQAVPTHYVEDEDMAYLMRRFRQTHDVWHALLDLGIEGHEEVTVHAFSWGQLQLPVSALVIVFGSLKHFVLERRWRGLRYGLWQAYQSGRDAAPLLPVYWERMWDEPMAAVRARYGVIPCVV
jgi:ubiquinone biosynthesis protein COQ4